MRSFKHLVFMDLGFFLESTPNYSSKVCYKLCPKYTIFPHFLPNEKYIVRVVQRVSEWSTDSTQAHVSVSLGLLVNNSSRITLEIL